MSNQAGSVRRSLSVTLIINLNAVEGADNKELKRNSLAESEKKKEEEQEGQCMNYTFTPQSEVPALFMSQKSPHSGARIVLCLLWNAIAVHFILSDSEVTAHTHTHTDVRAPSLTGPLPSHEVLS